MRQTVGSTLVVVTFVAAGWLTATQAAPAAVVWSTLGLLGLGGVVLLLVLRLRTRARKSTAPTRDRSSPAGWKDGRDYRVDVDDETFSLTNVRTGEAETFAWRGLTRVYVVAVDGAPGGGTSYLVQHGARALEIPLGAAGNERFLACMQEKLPGFDNGALLEGMAMTRGSKQVWPAPTGSPAAAASV